LTNLVFLRNEELAGDVIGCGIDFSQNRAFYTKNGELLGMGSKSSSRLVLRRFIPGNVFENIGKDCELYPSVGLRHQNESIRINLGHVRFLYDIEDHVNQQRSHVWSMIQSSTLDPSVVAHIANNHALNPHPDPSSSHTSDMMSVEPSKHQDRSGKRMKGVVDGLVFDYLIHHGYAGAARALCTQMQRSTSDHNLGPGSLYPMSQLD
jgi:Ran-binding protein 9/10